MKTLSAVEAEELQEWDIAASVRPLIDDEFRTALTDFVKLAQSELEKEKTSTATGFHNCDAVRRMECSACYKNSALSKTQSTLSRLLSGEVEK